MTSQCHATVSQDELFTTKQAAAVTAIKPELIRKYIQRYKGLIPRQKGPRNSHVFKRDGLDVLVTIRTMTREGCSPAEIKKHLKSRGASQLSRHGNPANPSVNADFRAVTESSVNTAITQQAELRRIIQGLHDSFDALRQENDELKQQNRGLVSTMAKLHDRMTMMEAHQSVMREALEKPAPTIMSRLKSLFGRKISY